MKKNPWSIKSEEVARRAGVSRSTVSKVINNYGDIGQETKDKVWKVIKECGYSPNQAARTLAGKSVDTLGLFFLLQKDEDYDITQDVIVDRMLASVVDSAARLGFLTLTMVIRDMDCCDASVIKDVFLQGRINGGIFLGCRKNEPVVEELVAKGFNIGLLDYPAPEQQEPNRCIVNFDTHSAEKAVDYLVGLGHRRIMAVYGDQFRFDGENKTRGVERAMEQKGLDLPDSWKLQSSFYLGESENLMSDFLSREKELPSAVFCANDHIAFGVMRAITQAGHSIPGDISVLGIDDNMISSYVHPPLTTFRVDFSEMLSDLTRAVVQRVKGEPEEIYYKESVCTLVERESCRPLK